MWIGGRRGGARAQGSGTRLDVAAAPGAPHVAPVRAAVVSSRRAGGALLILLLGCHPRPAADSGATVATSPREAPLQFRTVPIGLCEDYPEESRSLETVRQDMALLHEAGVRVLRVSIGWDGLEPARGQYDWGFWDAFVDIAVRQHGIRLVPYVAYTPRWISTGGASDYWKSPPRDVGEFEQMMARLVARYRETISSWEIWNEPDNRDYWLGTVADFARLVAAGSRAARAANPRARIVSGGVAGHVEFLDQVLSAPPAAASIDVVNAHAYPETWSPMTIEALPAYADQLAATVRRHGGRQPIWIAEVGYGNYRAGGQVSGSVTATFAYEHTPRFQAVALLRMLALMLASPPVDLIAWYELKDPPASDSVIGDENNRHLGVAAADHRPRPALAALRFMITRTEAGFATLPVATRRAAAASSDADAGAHAAAAADAPVVARLFEARNGDLSLFAWIPTHPADKAGLMVPPPNRPTNGDAVDPRRARIDVDLPVETSGDSEWRDPDGTIVGRRPVRHVPGHTIVAGLELRGGEIAIVTLRARARIAN